MNHAKMFSRNDASGMKHLMSTADQIKIVSVKEFAHNISTECERYASVVFAPPLYVLVRVRPEQVTQETWNNTEPHSITMNDTKYVLSH